MSQYSPYPRKIPSGPARKGPAGAEPSRTSAGQPGVALGPVIMEGDAVHIDARGVYYKTLNEQVREHVLAGAKTIVLDRVNGQRYIGAGIRAQSVTIIVNGVPGNDLATFMDGPKVIVNENAQDGIGNTMNSGVVVVHGDAGDVLGYGMRGGRLYIRGDVGYRVGIHMKAYKEQSATIVVGGRARDFFGEYMAGGELVLLGLGVAAGDIVGSYVGTGMHGGVIYLRGEAAAHQLGKELGVAIPAEEEQIRIRELVSDFSRVFALDADEILHKPFLKLFPHSSRPYGNMYSY